MIEAYLGAERQGAGMSEFIEFSLLGLLSGGVIALVALSFVLIYKGTGVINFAVGEVMMLGAYLYYAGAVTYEWPPWLAFLVSLGVIGMLAILLERAVLRPLSGQSTVAVLMATIGLSSIIHGGVEAVWGGDTYNPPGPAAARAAPVRRRRHSRRGDRELRRRGACSSPRFWRSSATRRRGSRCARPPAIR